ncbi:MAG: ketopantoate reductase family protein [Clostridia bacterium]|nr:ketopantoate reductase family protein [Clostridia bacterium]
MSQRIVLIGPGAIGGITAAFLAKAGDDITLVCKHSSIVELASGKGLHITGVQGTLDVPVRAVKTIEDLEGTFDFCLIATKAYDMPACAKAMLPYLKEDSLVVSMQNGICTDTLSAIVGEKRTVGCVIGFGGTMTGPGELDMTSTGDLIIGQPCGNGPRIQELASLLSHVMPTHVSDRIYEELYSKLIVNACITSLGAICGLRLGEMMKRRDARKIFLAIVREAVNVADAMHLTLPPYGGKLDYAALMAGTTPLDDLRRHATIRVVGIKYRRLKSSSLQSLERGHLTEVDCFNGYIAEKGRALGVATPVCDRLVAMIHEEEAGQRKICLENLADPVFTAL